MGAQELYVGLVGCGLVGNKRARGLGSNHRLAAVADKDLTRAESLASQHSGCDYFADWQAMPITGIKPNMIEARHLDLGRQHGAHPRFSRL